MQEKYEPVIGLEIHIQLNTQSKAFSSDRSRFGDSPNTNISEVSLGLPGTLPKINQSVIDHAIKLGLTCNSEISLYNEFSRKNYFYSDLPKGYQISQYNTPICNGGEICIDLPNEQEKKVALTRIHIEEDTGKSIHDLDPFESLIDLNRAGVPLLEMVTEPEIRSAEEAYLFLQELRKIVRYLDISNGNMEEGSMRCDVNISLRPFGTQKLGTKVEVKNINSFSNVKKAIFYETKRQSKILEKGETLSQETRNWDPQSQHTVSMRKKEDGLDYRYFPDPDLPPFTLTKKEITAIQKKLPLSPRKRFQRYISEFKLSKYDALNLTEDKSIADYFEAVIAIHPNTKAVANWVMGSIKYYLNENALSISDFPISASQIATMISLIDRQIISHTAARQKIFPMLLKNPDIDLNQEVNRLGIKVEANTESIRQFIEGVLAKNKGKVAEYKKGKKGLLGMFMGEVMKASQGKADPKTANRMLKEILEDKK